MRSRLNLIVAFLLFFAVLSGLHGCYKVLFLYSGLPELEWIKRLERACHALGWECDNAFCGDFPIELVGLEPADPVKIERLIEEIKPDFAVSLWDNQTYSDRCPHYLCVTGGTMRFHRPEEDISNVFKFKGILYSTEEIDFLKGFFAASGRKFNAIKWYPSCEKTEFKEIEPKKLFYCGWAWGENRQGKEYRTLFSLLDRDGKLEVYGPKERWDFIPGSAKGFLPVDGMSIRKAIHDAGIALVIHSSWHLDVGAPSARIFEAAAASSVIISDRHPFVLREFGDSVLYFDQNQSGEEMHRQIAEHREWIFSHPAEAKEMARRAHQLFLEKFTLEAQLENLARFHEQMSSLSK